MAIPFLTGQRLTADLLNANVVDFMPTTLTKTAATARASTVTPTDDPELSGIALGVGTWEIDFRGFSTMVAATTNGIRTRWGFTGTAADANRLCFGAGSGNTAGAASVTLVNAIARPWLSQDSIYSIASGAGLSYAGFREVVSEFVVTVAGNFSIQWAQQTSNASTVSLMQSSAVTIRKVR